MTDYAGYGLPEIPGAAITPSGQITTPQGTPYCKKAFDQFLFANGIWCVYIRAAEAFNCPRCRPSDPHPGEGDGDCPICLGTGRRVSLERMKVMLSKGRRTMSKESDLMHGVFPDTSFRAYFSIDNSPNTGDILLEVTWNVPPDKVKHAGEPTSIVHVYCLDDVEPFYYGDATVYAATVLDPYDHHLDPIRRALESRLRG